FMSEVCLDTVASLTQAVRFSQGFQLAYLETPSETDESVRISIALLNASGKVVLWLALHDGIVELTPADAVGCVHHYTIYQSVDQRKIAFALRAVYLRPEIFSKLSPSAFARRFLTECGCSLKPLKTLSPG